MVRVQNASISFMSSYLGWASPSLWTQNTCCCLWGCREQTQRFQTWAATWRWLGWKPQSCLAQQDLPAVGLAGNRARWADHRLLTRMGEKERITGCISNSCQDMNIYTQPQLAGHRGNTPSADKKIKILTQCLLLLQEALSTSQSPATTARWESKQWAGTLNIIFYSVLGLD